MIATLTQTPAELKVDEDMYRRAVASVDLWERTLQGEERQLRKLIGLRFPSYDRDRDFTPELFKEIFFVRFADGPHEPTAFIKFNRKALSDAWSDRKSNAKTRGEYEDAIRNVMYEAFGLNGSAMEHPWDSLKPLLEERTRRLVLKVDDRRAEAAKVLDGMEFGDARDRKSAEIDRTYGKDVVAILRQLAPEVRAFGEYLATIRRNLVADQWGWVRYFKSRSQLKDDWFAVRATRFEDEILRYWWDEKKIDRDRWDNTIEPWIPGWASVSGYWEGLEDPDIHVKGEYKFRVNLPFKAPIESLQSASTYQPVENPQAFDVSTLCEKLEKQITTLAALRNQLRESEIRLHALLNVGASMDRAQLWSRSAYLACDDYVNFIDNLRKAEDKLGVAKVEADLVEKMVALDTAKRKVRLQDAELSIVQPSVDDIPLVVWKSEFRANNPKRTPPPHWTVVRDTWLRYAAANASNTSYKERCEAAAAKIQALRNSTMKKFEEEVARAEQTVNDARDALARKSGAGKAANTPKNRQQAHEFLAAVRLTTNALQNLKEAGELRSVGQARDLSHLPDLSRVTSGTNLIESVDAGRIFAQIDGARDELKSLDTNLAADSPGVEVAIREASNRRDGLVGDAAAALADLINLRILALERAQDMSATLSDESGRQALIAAVKRAKDDLAKYTDSPHVAIPTNVPEPVKYLIRHIEWRAVDFFWNTKPGKEGKDQLDKLAKALKNAQEAQELEQLWSASDPRLIPAALKYGTWAISYLGDVDPFITKALGFYTDELEDCLRRAHDLHTNVIRAEVQAALSEGRQSPEGHLFTRAEVQAAIARLNPDEKEVTRIVTELQVRRLLALVRRSGDN